MSRAINVIAADRRHGLHAVDTVILDYAQRSTSNVAVTSVNGHSIEIDLQQPARLHTDDLLALDDGRLIEVVAAPEPLIEVRVGDVAGQARLAWHLGDRHVPAQLLASRIRVRRDAAIEALLVALGARIILIDAPFEPEGGAYEAPSAHDHEHHDHVHGPNCGIGHHHARDTHHGHACDHGHD